MVFQFSKLWMVMTLSNFLGGLMTIRIPGILRDIYATRSVTHMEESSDPEPGGHLYEVALSLIALGELCR